MTATGISKIENRKLSLNLKLAQLTKRFGKKLDAGPIKYQRISSHTLEVVSKPSIGPKIKAGDRFKPEE
jgi:hypothetical protein